MEKLKQYFLITLGVILVAASIEIFMAPNNIAAGGVTGIAIIINHLFPKISIGFLVLAMNVVLFIVAFLSIGNKFGGKTIYASLALSFIIWIMDKIVTPNMVITNNLLLASIFGTLISGIGMGLVFNQNASTGGTDILAKILNRFLHINIGKSLLAVDFIVTLFSGISFGADIGMYSLLAVMINGFVIDNVIEGLNKCKEIMIISSEIDLIRKFIIEDLSRGCTIIPGKGGYQYKDSFILYTVLSRKEFIRLKIFIKEVDRRAFITVSDAHEVLGEGFKDIFGDG